jgi:NAD(P)-dependent dehydrogenase (short-subunit alcohol dehydrogenase family)
VISLVISLDRAGPMRHNGGRREPEVNVDERKVAIVTGANSGIGKVTAAALAGQGYHVVMVCRDKTRGEAALADLAQGLPAGRVELEVADLASLSSVRELVGRLQRLPIVHALVNNAGGMVEAHKLTEDGIESGLAGNHVGHFLLTTGLLDRLLASGQPRVVNVASEAHRAGHFDFTDLAMQKSWSSIGAYGRAKLANVLFTKELQRRYGDRGLLAFAIHPGAVNTRFGETAAGWFRLAVNVVRPFLRTVEKGADTVIWTASAPEAVQHAGQYLCDRKVKNASQEAQDPAVALRLWDESVRLVGLDPALAA